MSQTTTQATSPLASVVATLPLQRSLGASEGALPLGTDVVAEAVGTQIPAQRAGAAVQPGQQSQLAAPNVVTGLESAAAEQPTRQRRLGGLYRRFNRTPSIEQATGRSTSGVQAKAHPRSDVLMSTAHFMRTLH